MDRELINILKDLSRISRIQVLHLQLCLTEKNNISYFTIAKCGIKIGSSEKLELLWPTSFLSREMQNRKYFNFFRR